MHHLSSYDACMYSLNLGVRVLVGTVNLHPASITVDQNGFLDSGLSKYVIPCFFVSWFPPSHRLPEPLELIHVLQSTC